jgi:hypothetical protein
MCAWVIEKFRLVSANTIFNMEKTKVRPTKHELVDKIYKYAVAELVVAVTGQEPPSGWHHSGSIKEAGRKLTEAHQARQAYKDDNNVVGQNYDNAIAELVVAVTGPNVPRGPYSEHVYEVARNVAESYEDAAAVYNHRLTDLEEYQAELERRREIGLTIDPATAETMCWYEDMSDRYGILDGKYHEGCVSREYFARNPGGEWVNFRDLPEATGKALFPKSWRPAELDDYEQAAKYYDAIAALVDAVIGQTGPRGPYRDPVYLALGALMDVNQAGLYEHELKRRREIGLTIDPATAETMCWCEDMSNPYIYLEERHHPIRSGGRDQFARNPGGEWVNFGDLPETTRKVLS